MEKEYESFVEDLREELLFSTGMMEQEVYFKPGVDNEKEDRMFLECARRGEICEVCALRTWELYRMYCGGVSMEEIIHSALRSVGLMKEGKLFDKALCLDEYDLVKDDLFIRLLNLEREKDDLQGAVYRVVGDIALVLYLQIGEVEGCTTSMKIRLPMVQKWGLEPGQVFEHALLNTYFMSPPRIFYWEKLFENPEYNGENFMNLCNEYAIRKDSMGSCLSTTKRTNGAVAIFLPGVAQRIGQLMGEDFYVVFTSIHEAMIHNDQAVDAESLKRILRETVNEATSYEDFLSYQIYHYNRQTECFSCE